MKRINGLFDKICTEENFALAYLKATKGKKKYKDVIEFNKDLENNLRTLLEELRTLTYKTSEYHIFSLYSGGKMREIYKLPIRDRILQHALMNYLEPIFRQSFIADTYASIKGRGIHLGLKRVTSALKDKENTQYCLKLDIHKFYPSIDQELMIRTLERKFKDKRLLTVLRDIVTSADKGVPIGNYTSQYFANFFLSGMDHYIKEKLQIKYYFRYCDDIVVLGPTKEYLWNVFHEIDKYVKSLNLELKPNWQVFPVEARSVDFLGYKSRHDYILVRKKTKKNFIKKIHNCKTPEALRFTLGSYWGIFCHANCINLWERYTGVKSFKDLGIKVKYRVSLKEIKGLDIEVTSLQLKEKRGKKQVIIYFVYDGQKLKCVTSSPYIIEFTERTQHKNFPFKTKIIQKENYYKFE